MPLFRATLTINRELLDRLHALPERARRNIYTTARTQMVPDLEKDANELMDPGPSPVSSPFAFGSPKSRRYWFVLIATGQVQTDGEHYIRDDSDSSMERSFRIEAAGNISEGLFKLFSSHAKSIYVLSRWAVAGHVSTGWPAQVQTALQLLREKAHEDLRVLWGQAIGAAWKGIDQA